MAFTDISYQNLGDYSKLAGIGDIKLNDYSFSDFYKDYQEYPYSTSTNLPDFQGDLLSSSAMGAPPSAWTFITAPQSVSYSVSSDVQRVEIFGSNTPPVIAASRGMRDLTLSEALMEGFTLGKSVQKQLDDLEMLMNVEVNSTSGFVNVPVYDVYAGNKSYGSYIIEQIEVDEQMRDLQGRATRAMVGVTFKQVPSYQIGKGIDQAGASTGGQALDTSRFTQANQQDAKAIANATSTPAAAAQKINGVDVPAGATNISSKQLTSGKTQISYTLNGVKYTKQGS